VSVGKTLIWWPNSHFSDGLFTISTCWWPLLKIWNASGYDTSYSAHSNPSSTSHIWYFPSMVTVTFTGIRPVMVAEGPLWCYRTLDATCKQFHYDSIETVLSTSHQEIAIYCKRHLAHMHLLMYDLKCFCTAFPNPHICRCHFSKHVKHYNYNIYDKEHNGLKLMSNHYYGKRHLATILQAVISKWLSVRFTGSRWLAWRFLTCRNSMLA